MRALLAGRGAQPLAVCRYDDSRGHPFAFGRAMLDELAALHGDKAVWRLLEQHGADVAEVPVAGPVPLDVDTPRTTRRCSRRTTDERPVALRRRRGVDAALPDVETLAARLEAVDYLADEGLATAMFLALRLPQPLLLEGEAGVGKTEAAKALAAVLDTPLIRLQCYEGIDAAEALYEWNYPRQLLRIRLAEAAGDALGEEDLFGPEYLIRRPLLQALEHPGRARRCCWSTSSTAPTTTSRRSCSSCWPSRR